VRFGDLARSFHGSDPFFRFDTVVAATAEVLRGSPWSAEVSIRDVAEVAFQESEHLPPTDEVHGFLDLLDQLARIER
jgi:hypothetical protein